MDLSEEDAKEYERQAGIRLLSFLKGVTNRAIHILPSEWRAWANFPDLTAPDWYDPTFPHLVLNEVLRIFGDAPKSIPNWIEMNAEQKEAAEILLQISKAAQLLRGIEPEKALRLLDAGIAVGHEITKAHIAPWEPIAETGKKNRDGARKGNETTYGTEEEKQKRWEGFRNALREKLAKNPSFSLTEARKQVAKDFGVSFSTIRDRTQGIKKPV